MPSEPSEETATFGVPGENTPVENPEVGHSSRLASDTVNVAISRLRARRIEGYVLDDGELMRRMTEEIQRAYSTLRALKEAGPAEVKRIHEEYMSIAQNTPEVSAETREEYEKMAARGQG